MKKLILLAAFLLLLSTSFSQKNATVSFEKWVSLKNYSNPVISPDGKTVVFSVTSTDWASNGYDTELWMCRQGETPFQLTRTAKNGSNNARFSPDGKFVSFVADRGDKAQLHIISVSGGEAIAISKDEDGVGGYDWSPDGSMIAYAKQEAESKKDKTVKERFGAYGIEGEEYRQNAIWLLPFNYDSVLLAGQLPCYGGKKDSVKSSGNPCYNFPAARRLTDGSFTITGFAWKPDGKQIIFSKQINPLINSGVTADIAIIDINTKEIKTLVNNPAGDFFARWNPDGTEFVYSSSVNDSVSNYYKNNRLFIYNLASGKSREIAGEIDENKNVVDWNNQGLFISALKKTATKLYRSDSEANKWTEIELGVDVAAGISFGKNSDNVTVAGRKYDGLTEIFTGKLGQSLLKITNSSKQIEGWNTPVNEVISWKSRDGAVIEGVFIKPKNFDARKKYPLLVVIHGGPTGIDFPEPTPTYVYPIVQWVEKGAVVLRVNYRGSAGYGEKFRSLNVRNLGVGDMWDVISGVDFLASKGFIDTSKMGAMGWSQGGYISAFLATNTNRFKAISVGAGISNWVTYYVNTDITPFTRQYLQATPWDDMNVYLKTSPMTNINKASTPTLIQHGEFDKRVPIPNAYELYRGLQDRGVPSKLIVYKGFGHGINKPKERLAAIWHNWQWFNKYIFGEEEPLPVE